MLEERLGKARAIICLAVCGFICSGTERWYPTQGHQRHQWCTSASRSSNAFWSWRIEPSPSPMWQVAGRSRETHLGVMSALLDAGQRFPTVRACTCRFMPVPVLQGLPAYLAFNVVRFSLTDLRMHHAVAGGRLRSLRQSRCLTTSASNWVEGADSGQEGRVTYRSVCAEGALTRFPSRIPLTLV